MEHLTKLYESDLYGENESESQIFCTESTILKHMKSPKSGAAHPHKSHIQTGGMHNEIRWC